MASGLTPTLTKKEFTNWIKGALALNITKDGLTDFVKTEVDQHHQRLLQLVPSPNVQNRCTCTIKKLPQCYVNRNHSHIVQGPQHLCSRGVCNTLMNSICNDHRFNKPSWKNTDPQKWCTDAFEIAKCFMSDGYSKKSSFNETDFNGILSVIINNTAFQTQLRANLGIEPNICTKARNVGRDIRHSPDHLLSDSDLSVYIDILINLLCDPAWLLNDPSATDAVKKLGMLKTNDLTIHEKDITEVLQNNIRETFSDQQRDLVQKIQDHYSKLKTDSIAEIDSIVADCKNGLEELTEKHKKDITKHAKRRKLEIRKRETKEKMEIERKRKDHQKDLIDNLFCNEARIPVHTFVEDRIVPPFYYSMFVFSKTTTATMQRKFQCMYIHFDLQEDLINHYSNNEARIPIVPLVANRNAPLVDFFVRPPIHVKDVPFCKEQNADRSRSAKTKVSSLKDLIKKDDKYFYRQIYIEAQAGYGKTAFSQSLAITWCQAHKPERKLTGKFLKDDIKAMKKFDYLFLLHLREYHSSSNCTLDDLIFEMVSRKLARRTHYSSQFILDTLNNCRCIVILDGLDEWVHPVTCRIRPEIPHNNHHYGCTVLCTTRPWKMSTVGLSANHIDRYVELSLLDKKSSEKLEKNAIGILNKNKPSNAQKNVSDFREAVSRVKDDVLNTPYVKLQLITLWFDGRLEVKTRCEVYTNITDFTLVRANNQRELPFKPSSPPENVVVPKCLKNNATCIGFMNPLLKLGKLAFHALCHNIKGSTLIFERTIVLTFLENDEIDFFLTVGLLSQIEDTQYVSTVNYNICFQHKSMQEYFAALYLATSHNTEESDSNNVILDACKSLPDVLAMSDMFQFLCGMNPNMYSNISSKLQDVVERDKITTNYRTTASDIFYYCIRESLETLQSYQSMQIACYQEALKNDIGQQCTFPLYDMFIYDHGITENDLSALGRIVSFNKDKIKSLFVANMADFLHIIEPYLVQSLQKFALSFHKYDAIYTNIISESAGTLTSLQFVDMEIDICIPILPGLNNLKAIGLDEVRMSHEDIDSIFRYIENRTVLTEVSLRYLTCTDHSDSCQGIVLNLSQHDQLRGLDLAAAPLLDIHVNNICLERSYVDGACLSEITMSSLFADLHGAPVLSDLTLWNIRLSADVMTCAITTLLQLRELQMSNIKLGDTALNLSPQMTTLESVYLSKITMTILNWRLCFDSIYGLSPSANVKLAGCKGPSKEEWEDIIPQLSENGFSFAGYSQLGAFITKHPESTNAHLIFHATLDAIESVFQQPL